MGLIPYKNEAYLNWDAEKNREAMRAALGEVGSRLDRSYPAIIGGKRIETDGEIVSVNPAEPSQVVGRTAAATEREADMALSPFPSPGASPLAPPLSSRRWPPPAVKLAPARSPRYHSLTTTGRR